MRQAVEAPGGRSGRVGRRQAWCRTAEVRILPSPHPSIPWRQSNGVGKVTRPARVGKEGKIIPCLVPAATRWRHQGSGLTNDFAARKQHLGTQTPSRREVTWPMWFVMPLGHTDLSSGIWPRRSVMGPGHTCVDGAGFIVLTTSSRHGCPGWMARAVSVLRARMIDDADAISAVSQASSTARRTGDLGGSSMGGGRERQPRLREGWSSSNLAPTSPAANGRADARDSRTLTRTGSGSGVGKDDARDLDQGIFLALRQLHTTGVNRTCSWSLMVSRVDRCGAIGLSAGPLCLAAVWKQRPRPPHAGSSLQAPGARSGKSWR